MRIITPPEIGLPNVFFATELKGPALTRACVVRSAAPVALAVGVGVAA